jgi:ABC-type antimicrobial peptide transport system permease subunit
MKLIRRSIRNVLRNPFRLILVVVLLSTSLMFVAAMTSLSTHAQQELAAVHQQLGTAITIRDVANESTPSSNNNGSTTGKQGTGGLTTPTPIPDSIVQKVENTPGVASTQESLVRPDPDGTLTGTSATGPGGQLSNITINVNAFSKGASHFTLSEGTVPTLVAGRSFRDSDANAYVAMMSQALAQINHLKLGSTFTLKGKMFTIIGLYTTADQFSASSIIVPLAAMQQVFGINGVDIITAYAVSYEQVEAVATRLRNALGKQYDVVTQGAQYDGVFSAVGAAQNAIQLALIVSIGIAVIVLIFAVLMLVRERTAEIAILKTIGASHVQILRQFWTEIVTLSVTAAILAALLLATLGPIISQRFTVSPPPLTTGTFTHMQNGTVINETPLNPNLSNIHLAAASLNVQTFLLILGLGIGLALLTSLIPTWFVANLKPVEVLRKAN